MTTSLNTTELATDESARDERTPLVLVAEDDPVQRYTLVCILEAAGFDVIAAVDGENALDLTRAHRPNLLIVDAIMPNAGGFEVIEAIRACPELSTTPVIMLSGLDDIRSRVHALSIGADDFVTKPVNRDELLARTRAQLRAAEAWRGQVNSMIDDFRTIRHRISHSLPAAGPIEAARTLIPRVQAELGCSSLAIIEADGGRMWVDEPFDRHRLDAIDLTLVPATHGSTTLALGDSNRCPLCGSADSGSVVVASAGSWGTGRAILVLGCSPAPAPGRRLLAEEVADACNLVLSERLRDAGLDAEITGWLDDVVTRRAFSIVFQPIVEMRTGRIVAQEALARFDDGTSPADVFAVANPTARHVQLELALIEAALDQAAAFPESVRIHVNVSPATVGTTELAALVARSSRRVVLEITEHALFSSTSVAALRHALPSSCLLAADDVGAGYAGLSQLLAYRPDVLKIDRMVVTDVDADPARQALVAGLVQFARATSSRVVAEGVERAAECQMLQRLGVEHGQGYFFARPAPLQAILSVDPVPQPLFDEANRRGLGRFIRWASGSSGARTM